MTKRPKNTAARSLVRFSLLAIVVAGVYLYTLTLPVANSGDLQEFKVSKGQSVRTIAENLQDAGLIRSPLYFRLLVRTRKLSLQAGTFRLSPAAPPSQVALFLTKGLAIDEKITIPEGFRVEQIAETAGMDAKEFLAAAKGLEGQLFPDTYFVKSDLTPDQLVQLLHDNYLKKASAYDRETLILASLIERETKSDGEKPIVAGILQNRLRASWPLELDATIQYIAGKSGDWWPNTTLLDRKRPSAYNTYLHTGLPPAPICNPGLASLTAAANPASTDYWFYLHDKSGQIHYAKTLEEHNSNIAKYINP